MNIKKLISFFIAFNAAAMTLTSCGREIQDDGGYYYIDSADEQSSGITDSADDSEPEAPVDVPEQEITANEIKYVKFDKTYQAESGTLSGNAKTAKKRKGFKGDGYVTGLKNEKDGWEITFEVTDSQYYSITLTAASDSAVENSLNINGEAAEVFSTSGSGKFESIKFENIYIEKGFVKISVDSIADGIDIDMVRLTASDEISKLDFKLENYALTNKNADYSARALYRYICGNYGKNILLGQHDTVGTVAETTKIYELTGKYPAIRFGDMMPYTEDMIAGENEIQYAKEWAEQGGIVSYMWHWTDPMGSGEYYSDKTDFDISKAVTNQKISTLSLEEIKKLNKSGKVSDECVAVVEDIDKVSAKLKELSDAGIPVLWRPLHEASNGYFWWGKDSDSYKWLWKLMYERQTKYHKLNNLIWIWSAQNASWYVGDGLCDVLSVDIYDKGNLSGQINRLLFLRKICQTKPIAMSECGNFPLIQNAADEKAMWSFIGQWGGNFLLDEQGNLNVEYNTLENLLQIYGNNITITRDELPDFSQLAQKIESDEIGKKNPVTTTAAKKQDGETESVTTKKAGTTVKEP